jgi:hypothetical protein
MAGSQRSSRNASRSGPPGGRRRPCRGRPGWRSAPAQPPAWRRARDATAGGDAHAMCRSPGPGPAHEAAPPPGSTRPCPGVDLAGHVPTAAAHDRSPFFRRPGAGPSCPSWRARCTHLAACPQSSTHTIKGRVRAVVRHMPCYPPIGHCRQVPSEARALIYERPVSDFGLTCLLGGCKVEVSATFGNRPVKGGIVTPTLMTLFISAAAGCSPRALPRAVRTGESLCKPRRSSTT